MKRLTLFLTLLIALASAATAETVTLAEFNSEEYAGWTYTRNSVLINTDNILGRKINLFHSATNGDFTLVSPAFAIDNIDTLTVTVSSYSHYALNEKYDIEQATPSVELLNSEGDVVESVDYYFEKAQLSRTFTVKLEVPKNLTTGQVRLAAWNADVNCPLAILAVTVTAEKAESTPVNGDVNADGSVNAGDVSAVYNAMLGTTTDQGILSRADVNTDGSINAGDVSLVYSLMLAQ